MTFALGVALAGVAGVRALRGAQPSWGLEILGDRLQGGDRRHGLVQRCAGRRFAGRRGAEPDDHTLAPGREPDDLPTRGPW